MKGIGTTYIGIPAEFNRQMKLNYGKGLKASSNSKFMVRVRKSQVFDFNFEA